MTVIVIAPPPETTLQSWLNWVGVPIIGVPDYIGSGNYFVVCLVGDVVTVVDSWNMLAACKSPLDKRPHKYYLVHIEDIERALNRKDFYRARSTLRGQLK